MGPFSTTKERQKKVSKLGIYDLNTIVTGDARVLAEGIPDDSVDLVLTDPPFGINFQYSNGYKDNPEQYEELIKWTITQSERVIKPGGLIFVFVAQLRLRYIWSLFPETSRIFAACKNFVQMRPVIVQYAYDPVIYWQKNGEPLKEFSGRDWHIANTANTNNRGLNEAGFHSCPRPLDTITYMVDNFSPSGGIVLDWFMGSGTTALACLISGRNYWGCEIVSATAESARQRVLLTQPPLFVPLPTQSPLDF